MLRTSATNVRRTLRFHSIDEVLAEAQRLAQTPGVIMLGNWTLGQALGHLAAAIHYSIDGGQVRVPWHLRLLGRLLKWIVLRKMPSGYRLPPDAEKMGVPPPSLSTSEGLERLQRAIERLKREPHRSSHFIFGRMNRREWDEFHCRHAELHLSFAVVESDQQPLTAC